VFITWINLIGSGLCSLSLQKKTAMELYDIQGGYKKLTALFLLGTWSTLLAISYLPVGLVHVIKSTTPLFVLFLSWRNTYTKEYPGEGRPSTEKIVWVVIVVLGAVIASINESQFTWIGLFVAMLSNLVLSAHSIILKTVVEKAQFEEEEIFTIMCLGGGIITTPIVLVLFLFFGVQQLAGNSMSDVAMMTLSFFCYNFFSLYVLKGCEVITHALLNACKRLVLVFSAAIVYGRHINTMTVLGVILVVFGNAGMKITKRRPKWLFITFILIFIFSFTAQLFINHPDQKNLQAQTQNVNILNERIQENKSRVSYDSTTPPGFGCVDVVQGLQNKVLSTYAEVLKGIQYVNIVGYLGDENKGDAAIWTAEQMVLSTLGITVNYVCSFKYIACDWGKFKRTLLLYNNSAVILPGGGNTKDIDSPFIEYSSMWFRIKIMSMFPTRPFRSFPQSISLKNETNLKETIRGYSTHGDVHIAARDIPSYAQLERDFQPAGIKITLVPDVVFAFGSRPEMRIGKTRDVDILFIRRDDKESKFDWGLGNIERGNINLGPKGGIRTYWQMDWTRTKTPGINKKTPWNAIASAKAHAGFQLLSTAWLVITDRLHVHIMSSIIGTPHILLDSVTGKNLGLHDTWTQDCNCARIAHNVTQAMHYARLFFEQDPSVFHGQ